jgi:tetratricopeptide (TPR) repeat protein
VRTGEALATLSAALAKYPLSAMEPSDRPYTAVAIAYALAGKTDEAQRMMTEYARNVPPQVQKGDPDRFTAAGQIAMAQGRYSDALASFRQSQIDNICVLCNTFEIGAAYAKLSQPDSALVYYERYLHGGGVFRIFLDVDHLAATYQRLGELYEAKGDRARARENYVKLADLWKNADPELQPIVKDTKERVARLSGEQ